MCETMKGPKSLQVHCTQWQGKSTRLHKDLQALECIVYYGKGNREGYVRTCGPMNVLYIVAREISEGN
jgi:hypothetical protein